MSRETHVTNDKDKFSNIDTYQVLATTVGNIPLRVFTFDAKKNINYYLGITSSAKAYKSNGGLFIIQKNRVVNENGTITIVTAGNEGNNSLPGTNIQVVHNEDNKVSINLIGLAGKTINWTLEVKIISA